jgi:alpha-galactosidase
MLRALYFVIVAVSLFAFAAFAQGQDSPNGPTLAKPIPAEPFHLWANTPPMGWNSWDCFGAAVNETQTKENADYMADKLAAHGWQYIVVDIQWYESKAKGFSYRKNAHLEMDEYGRLLPAPDRFPSAVGGAGFKPLADYIHAKGLKFGIHLLRGIPRQAVEANTPILGTAYHAADIADKDHPCKWNPDMWGVDMTKPGAQEYYNSVFQFIASWDVDFVKVDDLSRPYDQNKAEVEAIREAIDRSGRPIVLSTSPGETLLSEADHVATHANMWRISDDVWDSWKLLKPQFQRCKNWAPYAGPGHWPDADMLPFGHVRAARKSDWTHFTHDEQYTVMTLWSICRSPLFIGANLPNNDEFTLQLLANDEVIAVDQHSTGGHELFRNDDLIAWVADVPDSRDKYLALFNACDAPEAGEKQDAGAKQADSEPSGREIKVELASVGFSDPVQVRDLWHHNSLGNSSGTFSATIPYHGAGLYRLLATP